MFIFLQKILNMKNELKQFLLDLKARFEAQWGQSELDMWKINFNNVDSLTESEAELILSKLKQTFLGKI